MPGAHCERAWHVTLWAVANTTNRTVLCPEWIVDGTGSQPLTGYAVVVGGNGRIEAVQPVSEIASDPSAEVVRAPGATLLPGLINMHAHLTLVPDNGPFVPYMDGRSDAALALQAAANAAQALRAGVTTVRDCGSRGRTVLDLRSACASGLLPGPRLLVAGWALTITGGHMRPFGGEADGVDGVRVMVRRLVSAGADFIKIAGSGGGTPGSLPSFPSYGVEELRAIVDTAHALGRRVTMHCTAAKAIANAAQAGVDSIEHGYFSTPAALSAYDERIVAQLVEQNISITPTLQVAREMVSRLPSGAERDEWEQRRELLGADAGRFHRAGVRITGGSDAGWRFTGFDTYWHELDELVACGLSPVEAIHAATGGASRAVGLEDDIGSLRPGRLADLLLVDGDATRDITRLANVRAVYQAGVLVVGEPSIRA
jgi:imidazolonepropionase-like amidohydrolase